MLWHVGLRGSLQPYQVIQAHSDRTNDFVFINHGSFMASCGRSADKRYLHNHHVLKGL